MMDDCSERAYEAWIEETESRRLAREEARTAALVGRETSDDDLCVCRIGHVCTAPADETSVFCRECLATSCHECGFIHGLHNEGACGQWRDQEFPDEGE